MDGKFQEAGQACAARAVKEASANKAWAAARIVIRYR